MLKPELRNSSYVESFLKDTTKYFQSTQKKYNKIKAPRFIYDYLMNDGVVEAVDDNKHNTFANSIGTLLYHTTPIYKK